MNENDDYSIVQRRLCAVIAKSEWTSSRMRMQKSGDELRESRAKSNRTANKFLQELLEKRSDTDLTDDNGAVDRYNKFLKNKSTLNDDTNSSLDEFDRRLRSLNNHKKNSYIKLNHQNINTFIDKNDQQIINDYLQSTIEIQNDKKNIHHNQQQSKTSRILPVLSTVPITSTPNDTTNEILTSVFHDDEIQEYSNVESTNISFIDSEVNHIESPIILEQKSTENDKTELLNTTTSSLKQTLYTPKARRSDGTEFIPLTSTLTIETPLRHASSNILLFNHCHFPRSLTSREKQNSTLSTKRQLPSLPIIQSIESKQFQADQLYNLLDNLDNNSNQSLENNFTNILDQLTLSTVVIQHQQDEINNNDTNLIDQEEEEENIHPNLFSQTFLTSQEKLFYSKLTININDIKNLFLYTMTLSTVQLSASILLPYSILNGRRPLLKCSNETNFKKYSSKQKKNYTYQVTAIESCLNNEQFQQNDILLQINDQLVWNLSLNTIVNILKKSNQCSVTIARLCQPFV